jgi:hypothetical protein
MSEETLESVRVALACNYPTLAVYQNDTASYIEGVLQLEYERICFESFLIQIDLPNGYPHELPKVFEIGGRIPKDLDHHVNRDGSLCLGVPDQLWLQTKGQFEIGPFIKRLLCPFLVGISEKLRTGEWPGVERSHGASGICEFYGTFIDTAAPAHVIALLHLLQKKDLKGHWLCPCGSGKVLRHRHGRSIRDLASQGLPKQLFVHALKCIELDVSLRAC